jgi:hypothetical protein
MLLVEAQTMIMPLGEESTIVSLLHDYDINDKRHT